MGYFKMNPNKRIEGIVFLGYRESSLWNFQRLIKKSEIFSGDQGKIVSRKKVSHSFEEFSFEALIYSEFLRVL